MSALSEYPDAMGFFYGFAHGDRRQICVRREGRDGRIGWHAYVGGEHVAAADTKADAESAALEWIARNRDESPA